MARFVMRVTSVALLAASALGSVGPLDCVKSAFDSDKGIAASSCGDRVAISECLNAQSNVVEWGDVTRCFVESGCAEEASAAEATRIEMICARLEAGYGELKRQVSSKYDGDESSADGKKTPGKTAARQTAATQKDDDDDDEESASTAAPTAVRTTARAPTKVEPSTTAEEPATTATPSTLPSTVPSTTAPPVTTPTAASATSDSTTSDSTISALTTEKLVCSVTSMVSTTLCSISAGRTVSCFSTITPTASCAPGVICFPNSSEGAEVCMKRDNRVSTSGVVVALVFGASIIGFAVALIIMRARDRKQNRRLQLLAQAAAGEKIGGKSRGDIESALPYQRRRVSAASDANLPLISPGGTRSDQQYYPQETYFDQGRGGSNLSPGGQGGVPPVPTIRLHQGLGALDEPQYR